MKIYRQFLIYLLLLPAGNSCLAQLHPVFKLDIYSGLPSNHVYMTLKDKLGYLWIATDKGLVRYNGYTAKIYSSSAGLPYDDVYGLFLDKKERLWLYGFATSIGYIYNNRYHSIPLNNDGVIANPQTICYFDGEILFTLQIKNEGVGLIAVQNDTARKLYTKKGDMVNTPDGHMLTIGSGANANLQIYRYENGSIVLERSLPITAAINDFIKDYSSKGAFLHYVIFHHRVNNILVAMDMRTGNYHKIHDPGPEKQKVAYAFDHQQYLYIIYENNMLKLDSNLQTADVFPLQAFTAATGINGLGINNFLEDDFWKDNISTAKRGLFFNSSFPARFVRKEAGLQDYVFTGYGNDTTGYWWNAYTGTLAQVTNSGYINYKKIPFKKNPEKIVPYDTAHAIILADKLYLLRNRDIKVQDVSSFVKTPFPKAIATYRGLGACVTADQTIYAVLSSGFFKYHFTRDTIVASRESADRFSNIVQDRKRNILYAYHREQVLVYQPAGARIVIHRQALQHLGISSIEQILADDTYGNIIIKDRDGLVCIHPETFTVTRLLTALNLADTKLAIHRDTLLAAGRFGMVFSKINGVCSFKPPVLFANYKDWHYTYVYDMQVLPKHVWLKTDKGLYLAAYPSVQAPETDGTTDLPYRLIASYNDTAAAITGRDTLRIDRYRQKILFDIINPAGNGHAAYAYYIKGEHTAWQALNADELNLQWLQPGRYYQLAIKAGDNVWHSKTHHMTLYLIPEWWETTWGRRLLGIAGVSLLLFATYIIVVITRRQAIRKAAKKNRLLELEIKSIYSQINPHFIFNTLNGALQFIKRQKLDDAYNHIFRFSSLLRSYLGSSRNRFISIATETENLRNYIELQQTRFGHIFTYSIVSTVANDAGVYIPSLLLQPIVENAINHGLLPADNGGRLIISFLQDEDGSITCIVDDDGTGLDTAMRDTHSDPLKKESYGSRLIDELIALHNEYEDMGISIRYENKQPPTHGTTVYIVIKKPRYNEKV